MVRFEKIFTQICRYALCLIISYACAISVNPCYASEQKKSDGKNRICNQWLNNMTESEKENINGLREWLVPILSMQVISPETVVGRTVGEGLILPTADHILEHALPNETVSFWKADTMEWICAVLRPQWLPTDLYNNLYAIQKIAGGEDAFIGGWIAKERRFQVVVTSDRVHILTKPIVPAEENIPMMEQPDRILKQANEILRLPQTPNRTDYFVQPFRGLILGDRVIDFASDWHETLQFLSDGTGVKFSVLKYKCRTGEPKETSPRGEPVPWFQ